MKEHRNSLLKNLQHKNILLKTLQQILIRMDLLSLNKTLPLSLSLFWAWYSSSKLNKKPQKHHFKECLADTHKDAFTLIQQKIPLSLDTSGSSWSSLASFGAWYSSSKLNQKPQKHHFRECSADTNQDAFTLIKKKQYLCPLTPELPPDHQLLCSEPDTPCLNSTTIQKKISSKNDQQIPIKMYSLFNKTIPLSLDTSVLSWSSLALFWAWYCSSKLLKNYKKHYFK